MRRAVLADVTAPQLYLDLVGTEHLPARLLDDLRRFEWDGATVKVDWALSGPIPWQQPDAAGAGTVHVGGGLDDLSDLRPPARAAAGAGAAVPARRPDHHRRPDPLAGRHRVGLGATPTCRCTRPRTPAASSAATGPTRTTGPGSWTGWKAQMEAYAPGFRDLVIGRHVKFPGDLEAADANLAGGAVAGGTAAVHQQLIFRPTAGLGRPETPIEGLYLASASAHPGGGVHGAPGANAALAALRAGSTGRLALAVTRALTRPARRPGLITGDARSVPAGAPGPVTGGGRDVRAGAGSPRSGS